MLLDLVQLDSLQSLCGAGDLQRQWQEDHMWFHGACVPRLAGYEGPAGHLAKQLVKGTAKHLVL